MTKFLSALLYQVIIFTITLSVYGCNDGAESPSYSSIADTDVTTGTVTIDGIQHNVSVVAVYDAAEISGMDGEILNHISIKLKSLATNSTQIEMSINIPFQEGQYPNMPLDVANYRFDVDGDGPMRPLRASVGIVLNNSSNSMFAFSGEIDINVNPEVINDPNEEITFEGSFKDIEFSTLDGSSSVTVAGQFLEIGYYDPSVR